MKRTIIKIINFITIIIPVNKRRRSRLLLLAFSLLLLLNLSFLLAYRLLSTNKTAEAAWYNPSWLYRQQLIFNNSDQSTDLTNFSAMVKLTSANFTFNQTQSSGQDIRFTDSDGTTLLPYEIEKYDSVGQEAVIWVNVPQINASSSTDYIYVYWGNLSAADGQSADNTWNSNYKGVYHLSDNAASTTVTDSSGNTNTLTTSENTNNGYYQSISAVAGGFMTAGSPKSIYSPITSNSEIYADVVLDSSNFPVITYYDNTNLDLIVMHCNDRECKGDDESVVIVDSTGNTGAYPSIKLDSLGYPVISYTDITNADLKLVHCGNADCSSGNTTNTVDNTNTTGYFSDLVLDGSGYPVIAYYYNTGADLKLAHCSDTNCSSVTVSTVDSTGSVGADTYQQIAVVLDGSGYPVISYHDVTNTDLKIAHCNDVNCAGSDESLTSPYTTGNPYYTDLVLDSNGYPMVVTYELTNLDLIYIHCDDINCAGDESTNTVKIYDSYFYTPQIKLNSSGNPVIFGLISNAYPYVYVCNNTSCSSTTGGYLSLYNNYVNSNSHFAINAADELTVVYGARGKYGKYDVNVITTFPKLKQTYDTDYNFGTGSFTVSGWFKSTTARNQYLLSRYDSDQGFKIWSNYAGHLCFGTDDDSSWGPDDSACSGFSQISTNVDSGGAGGLSGSVQGVKLDSSGYPVIAYYDSASADLELVHCNDTHCAGANETTASIDTTGTVGQYASLVLDGSGYPVIAYYDGTNYDLKVTHCGNANCSSGNTINTVDSTGTVGLYTSIVLDGSGYPVIVYYDSTNADVKIAHCGDANCGSGNAINTIASSGTMSPGGSSGQSLVLDGSGYPVIVYTDSSNADVEFVHCNDVNCSGGDETNVTINGSSYGYYPSIVLDSSGYPVIAYYNAGLLRTELARCADANCASYTTNTVTSTLDTDSGVQYTNIALNSTTGYPVISSSSNGNWSAIVAVCNDAYCAGGNETEKLIFDDVSYSYTYIAMVLDNNNAPIVVYNNSADLRLAYFTDTTTYADTGNFSDGSWHHFTAVKNGTSSLTLYVDGVSVGTDVSIAGTGTLTSDSAGLLLGGTYDSLGRSVYNWDGEFDEIQIDATARSADWVKAQYLSESNNFINTSSVEIREDPNAYWKFDEGTGTTTKDSSGNNHTATLTLGPTWQSEDMCTSGKCIKFDGVNDYVAMGTGQNYFPLNTFSICSQVKTPGLASGMTLNGIISLTYGLTISLESNGKIYTRLDNGSTIVGYTAAAGKNLYDNKWHQVCLTYDGTNQSVYADGLNVGSTAATWLGTTRWPTAPTVVGNEINNTMYKFNGFIDDVKIYPYARSAAQIKTDYNARGSATSKGNSVELGRNSGNNYLADGLVGYWKLDESATPSIDSSGNGNSGTWAGTTAATSGMFGNGAVFDGDSDYVEMADTASLSPGSAFTFSTWIYQTGACTSDCIIFNKENEYEWRVLNGTISYAIANTSPGWAWVSTGITISQNTWTHLILTYDSASQIINAYKNGDLAYTRTNSTGSVTDGGLTLRLAARSTGAYFGGKLDETRIYNRSLSPKEARDLYNWAPGPVGHWKIDENTGTTSVNDTSGNTNTGTMTGTMTSADWVPGKYGSALDFDGTDDALTIATANDSFVDFNGSEAFSGGVWVYIKTMPGSGNQDAIITKWDETSTLRGYRLIVENDDADSTGNFQVDIYDESADQTITVTGANDSVSQNTWYYVSFSFNGGIAGTAGDLKLYTNGVLTGSNTVNVSFLGLEDVAVDFSIGDYDATDVVANNTAFTGVIDDVHIYNYVRTPKHIVQDMNGGHPIGGSPVGSQINYWKMDKGYGTTAHDSIAGGKDLTFAASASDPSWSNEGKFGKSLYFDGDDYATNVSFAYTFNQLSVSAWFKGGSNSTSPYARIISKWTPGFIMAVTSSDTFRVYLWDDAEDSLTGITNIDDGNWHYLAFTVDTANGLFKIYVDGKLENSKTSSITTAITTTNTIYVGGDANRLTGYLDEVKIYSAALSAEEINSDYYRGNSVTLGSLGTNTTYEKQAGNQIYCVPGDSTSCVAPGAEWNFEEKNGSYAYDSAGNSNTITLTNTSWTTGKDGSAVLFNGSTTYGSVTDSPSISLTTTGTLEAWVNPARAYPSDDGSNKYRSILNKWTASSCSGSDEGYLFDWYGTNTAGILRGLICNGTSTSTIAYGTGALTPNTWYHVVYSWDGSYNHLYVNGIEVTTKTAQTVNSQDDTGSLLIGDGFGGGANYRWDGKIDGIKIYNYARTQAQIAYDFNRGAPVTHYKFDECSGDTAYDASGNGKNGAVTIGGTGTQDGIGTCTDGDTGNARYNGAGGKLNSGFSFDGTDDKIVAGSGAYNSFATNSFSVSAWLKTTDAGNQKCIASIAGGATGWRFGYQSGKPYFLYGDGTHYHEGTNGTVTINDANWHLITTVYNYGSTVDSYVDGKFVGSTDVSDVTGSASNGSALYIGTMSGSSGLVNGLIDDLQIYNYSLTENQILTIYNSGAAVKF